MIIGEIHGDGASLMDGMSTCGRTLEAWAQSPTGYDPSWRSAQFHHPRWQKLSDRRKYAVEVQRAQAPSLHD